MLVGMAICREIVDTQQAFAAGEPAESTFFIGLYYLGHSFLF